MASKCNCTDILLHAKAVESAVFSALMNAMNIPEQQSKWEKHADLLERKFITDHGMHYADVIYPRNN